jgi:transposase
MNASTITHVGMDVHAASIFYSVRLPSGEVREVQTRNDQVVARKTLRRLVAETKGPVRACYEAGPTGFALQRAVDGDGVTCVVIAPGLIPRRSGDRCKTDRRDARHLRELDEANCLTEVHVPTPKEEAARSLTRHHASASADVGRAKTEIKSLLLRLSKSIPNNNWSRTHRTALEKLRLEEPVDQLVLEDALLKLRQAEERQARLRKAIEALAEAEPFAAKVALLRCFKGIDTIVAMTIVTEMVSPERFERARAVMSYAGLAVSEHSSGESRRQGGITKTGNSHLRRALVTAARHASKPVVREGKTLRGRRKDQPTWIVEMARKAERRLHARHVALTMRGKNGNLAVTAVARELTGFTWAALTHECRTANGRPASVDADGVVQEN